MAHDDKENVPEGYTVIYRPYITLKDGTRRYPPNGLKAWRLVVRIKR